MLIALAICLRPAYGGSASAGASQSGPCRASGSRPAAAGVSPPLPPTAVARPPGKRSHACSRLHHRELPELAPVLVIPAQEMPPETYDRIVEDLSIMSRIIEKSLREARNKSMAPW